MERFGDQQHNGDGDKPVRAIHAVLCGSARAAGGVERVNGRTDFLQALAERAKRIITAPVARRSREAWSRRAGCEHLAAGIAQQFRLAGAIDGLNFFAGRRAEPMVNTTTPLVARFSRRPRGFFQVLAVGQEHDQFMAAALVRARPAIAPIRSFSARPMSVPGMGMVFSSTDSKVSPNAS